MITIRATAPDSHAASAAVAVRPTMAPTATAATQSYGANSASVRRSLNRNSTAAVTNNVKALIATAGACCQSPNKICASSDIAAAQIWLFLPGPSAGNFQLEREAQKRADDHDHGENSDAGECRSYRDCADNVRSHQELQTKQN